MHPHFPKFLHLISALIATSPSDTAAIATLKGQVTDWRKGVEKNESPFAPGLDLQLEALANQAAEATTVDPQPHSGSILPADVVEGNAWRTALERVPDRTGGAADLNPTAPYPSIATGAPVEIAPDPVLPADSAITTA